MACKDPSGTGKLTLVIHLEAWYRESLEREFEEAVEQFRHSWDLPSLLRLIRVTRRTSKYNSPNYLKMEEFLRDYAASAIRDLYPGEPIIQFVEWSLGPLIRLTLPGDRGSVTMEVAPPYTEKAGEIVLLVIGTRGRGTLKVETNEVYTIPALLEALGIET